MVESLALELYFTVIFLEMDATARVAEFSSSDEVVGYVGDSEGLPCFVRKLFEIKLQGFGGGDWGAAGIAQGDVWFFFRRLFIFRLAAHD